MKSQRVTDAYLITPETESERKLIDSLLNPPDEPEEPGNGGSIPGDSSLPTAGYIIPTFHCAGVYWDPPKALKTNQNCPIRFAERRAGAPWVEGFPLHYDGRSLKNTDNGQKEPKARGSIVRLKPGVEYVVQTGMWNGAGRPDWMNQLIFRTWGDFKINDVVKVNPGNSPLRISRGGSRESGYVVYEAVEPGALLDMKDAHDWCVDITAPFVVVRGFKLAGPKNSCVLMDRFITDVVIEDNEMTDWGRFAKSGAYGKYGRNYEGAITNIRANTSTNHSQTEKQKRYVIQRNRIHDPRYGSNSWSEGHPNGPHYIYLVNSGGNHVIRYNDMRASENDPAKSNKYCNDGLGAGENCGPRPGFPGNDCDIYHNNITHTMDDVIEAEGHCRNTRLWRNRMAFTDASFIATNCVHVGPCYIWENTSVNRATTKRNPTFLKTGDRNNHGAGRKFVFHNLNVQRVSSRAIDDVSNVVNGVYARNNIWQLREGASQTYMIEGPDNNLDYNMSSGKGWGTMPSGHEKHGLLNALPKFKEGHGAGGNYQLAADSPGKGKAEHLPNFSTGNDMGCHQEGQPEFVWGPEAAAGG